MFIEGCGKKNISEGCDKGRNITEGCGKGRRILVKVKIL